MKERRGFDILDRIILNLVNAVQYGRAHSAKRQHKADAKHRASGIIQQA